MSRSFSVVSILVASSAFRRPVSEAQFVAYTMVDVGIFRYIHRTMPVTLSAPISRAKTERFPSVSTVDSFAFVEAVDAKIRKKTYCHYSVPLLNHFPTNNKFIADDFEII